MRDKYSRLERKHGKANVVLHSYRCKQISKGSGQFKRGDDSDINIF